MLFGLDTTYWLTVHSFFTIFAVLIYAVTAHVLQQRRHPTAAIAWVLFMVIAPYIALPLFMTFGSRKQARSRNRPLRSTPPPTDAEGPWAVQTALALGQPEPAAFEDLHIHADGRAAVMTLRRIIDRAETTIDLCTFIIGRDVIGHSVIEHLVAKARAGIKVRMMLDGLGSLMRSRPDLRPLRAAGVEFTLFVPPLHSPLKGRTNLRDHRKMLIADAGLPTQRLWCGGRNLACEYFEGEHGAAPWHDLTFDLAGAFVRQASTLFDLDWAFANGHKQHARLAAPDAVSGTASDAASGTESRTASGTALAGTSARAQLIASGPDQADDTVYSLLVTAAYRARRRIALATPYFVPDSALLTALCLAARRGVQVDLLLPAHSNHFLSDVARRRALRALAEAGGRIIATPRMMHAKLAVVDATLALCGSANLDSRSLFLNYEMMVAFHDPDAIARFTDWFDRESAGATPFTPKRAGLWDDIAEGLVLWVGFQL